MRGEAASAPTTTGMSYLRLSAPSVTLVNRNARRWSSGKPALELPAHQRMQLGVLVDRTVDARHQALRFEVARCCWKSSGGPCIAAAARPFSVTSSIFIYPCALAPPKYDVWPSLSCPRKQFSVTPPHCNISSRSICSDRSAASCRCRSGCAGRGRRARPPAGSPPSASVRISATAGCSSPHRRPAA